MAGLISARALTPGGHRPERVTRVGGEMPGGRSRHSRRAIPRLDSTTRPPDHPTTQRRSTHPSPRQANHRARVARAHWLPAPGSVTRSAHRRRNLPSHPGQLHGAAWKFGLSWCHRGGNLGRCATRARALGLPEATPPRKFPADHTPVTIRSHQLRSSPGVSTGLRRAETASTAGPTGSPLPTQRQARQARRVIRGTPETFDRAGDPTHEDRPPEGSRPALLARRSPAPCSPDDRPERTNGR